MTPRIAIAVRSAASVLALVAAIAVAVVLAFGGRSHHHVTRSDESRVLREAVSARPLSEPAAVACFRRAAGIVAVHASGDDVDVTFAGTRRPMRITFRRTVDSAIRYAYAHESSTTYSDNTNWFDTPTRLTDAGNDALGRCLPDHLRLGGDA